VINLKSGFFFKLHILKIFVEKFELDFEKSIKKLKENLENNFEKFNIQNAYKANIYKRHENLLKALNEF